MGWGRVSGTAASNVNTTSPLPLTMAAAMVTGDRVVVACTVWGGAQSVTGITGTFCGTFTKDAETASFVSGGVDVTGSVWSAPVTSDGTPVLSITYSASACVAAAQGFSGLDTSASSAAVDASGTATDGSPSSATWSATTSGNATAASELLIGGYHDSQGGTANPTEGSGFTMDIERLDGQASVALESKDAGSSGATKTADGTTGSTDGWGCTVVVYKLAAGGGGGSPGPALVSTISPLRW